MTAEAAKAEHLIQQMEQITSAATRRGYMSQGERSLHNALEAQVRAIIKRQETEHMRLEGQSMRQAMELGDLEAELRELKDTRNFLAFGTSIPGRTSGGIGSGPSGQSILEFKIERRAGQSSASGSVGGYLVPGFVQAVVAAAKLEDEILANSTVILGDGRQPVYAPAFDDTANMAQEVAQNASYSSGPDLLFTSQTQTKNSYRSGIFVTSVELAQDSAIDQVLASALGKRQGRKVASNLAAAMVSGAHAVTSAKTAVRDKLSDLMDSTGYAELPGSAFMMHPSQIHKTILQGEVAGLRCVHFENGRYTIYGKPVLQNRYLPAVSDSPTSTTVFFGMPDRISMVLNNFRVSRFVERYAEFGQIGFELLFQASDPVIVAGGATDYPIVSMSL